MKKSILIIGLILAFVLSACSSHNSDNKNDGGKEVIKFAAWGGPEEIKELQGVVDKVNDKAENYKIDLMTVPGDYYTKIQTQIAGGMAPDLFYLSQEWVPNYASKGVLLDITDMAKKDKNLNLDDYYEEPLRSSKYDGKLYGLPWIAQPYVLYYNKKLFDEAGVDYPNENWTWDDLRKAAKTLTKDVNDDDRIDQYGFIPTTAPLQLYLWSMGGDVIKDGKVVLDSQNSIDGLELFNQLVNKDNISPTQDQIDKQGDAGMFKAGKIAMFIGGAADDLDHVDGLDVGMATVPRGKEKVSFSWIASVVASSSTENKEVTYQAMVDLTNGIHHWKIVPPVKSLTDEIGKINPTKKYAVDVIEKAMETARGFHSQAKEQEIGTALWEQAHEPIWHGKKTPEEGAKDAAEKIREITGLK